MITSDDLRDVDNHTQCECGNMTHWEYSWDSFSGDTTSCPECMANWQGMQINELKRIIFDLTLNEHARKRIKEMYADLIGISLEELEEIEHDFCEVEI